MDREDTTQLLYRITEVLQNSSIFTEMKKDLQVFDEKELSNTNVDSCLCLFLPWSQRFSFAAKRISSGLSPFHGSSLRKPLAFRVVYFITHC